jgi:LysM repeat protein
MTVINKKEVYNETDTYQFLFDPREVSSIVHYKLQPYSPRFKKINISFKTHTWKNGDKLYKLANKYYNTYDFWWVIALINKKFIDSDYSLGQVIIIPLNPTLVIDNLRS